MLPVHVTRSRVEQISGAPGLVAFWSFEDGPGLDIVSRHDPALDMVALPFLLTQIGDSMTYPVSRWPFTEGDARLTFSEGGPFNRSIRMNQGHIFGIVPRPLFEGTWLDINRRQAFTMIAWMRFVGERHLIGGVWDEGGWDRYGGRRQVALFGGLFDQQGAIAHISETGAACYPQSTVEGAQYARTRAIDGAAIDDGEWVSIAMTFDPHSSMVTAYKNGIATPAWLTDPVMADVFGLSDGEPANPIRFPGTIFHPDATVLKFSGFDYRSQPVGEHRLAVDFAAGQIQYQQRGGETPTYRVVGQVVTTESLAFELDPSEPFAHFQPSKHGQVTAKLEVRSTNGWEMASDDVLFSVQPGAPFTFGRALGVGNHGTDFGSQMDLAGFAVFNRVLSSRELAAFAFKA